MADVDLERETWCVEEGGDRRRLRKLREAMLHHEKVFRCQVLELHRLYWTQKNLMHDLSVTDYGNCSRQFSGMPLHIPNKTMQDIAVYMHEPMMSFLGGQTTGSREMGVNFSSRIEPELKRMFRAQYSAAECGGSVGNTFLPGNGSTDGEIAFDLNEPQFPLACLKDYANRNVHRTNTFHRQGSSYAQEVIDLDGSSDMEIINKGNAASSSFGQEVSSTKMGSLVTMKQYCSSNKEATFDLNVSQPEDSPDPAADTDVFTSSNGSIASILTSKAKRVESNCKVDLTISGRQGSRCGQNCVVVESSSSQNSNSMVLNETSRSNWKSFLDLNSLKPTDHTDFAQVQPNSYGSPQTSGSYNATTEDKDTYAEKHISDSDLKKSDTNLQSLSVTAGLQNLPLGVQLKQVEHENSDEDTVSSKNVHGDQAVQVYSSNLFKHPEQPGRVSTKENSESTTILSIKDNTSNQIIKSDTSFVSSCSASGNLNTQTCGIICSKGPHSHLGLEANKEISLETDSVLMAAECLTFMSSANPNRAACGFKEVYTSGIETNGNDQPQCSNDSLELIVLSLPELCEDAYSPPVRPQVEEQVKSIRRYNSRRGRQLRDFQRDILPGLVSLSRHEICEDMHAFAEISRLYESKRKEANGYTCRRNRSGIARNRRSRCR